MTRRKTRMVLALLVSVLLLGSTVPAGAQALVKVKDIVANPKAYANEVVSVEGFATQWVESTATTTSFYFLKDDWGGIIKVRTSKDKPDIGARYRVRGIVGIDVTDHNDPFISEESRIEVRNRTEGTGQVTAAVPVSRPESGMSTQTMLLIAAIIVAVVVLVGLLVWLLRSRSAPGAVADVDDLSGSSEYSGPAGPLPAPEPVEGHTIKIFAPPPGTLKILPGRLEVAAGDDTVKEIRFYRVKGQTTPEVTFGRATGPAFTHVQLKPMTVSSRQAKLTFINSEWILTNFAPDSSNPTRVNGTDLPVDGQAALKDGDTIDMGEVKFVFHAN